MSSIVQWMDRKFYPDQANYWDDDLFREVVVSNLNPEMKLLDLGAGAGILPQTNFRGLVAEAVGVDLDPRVTTNPHLDRGLVVDGESLPFPDGYFDIVVSDNVLEHLDRPGAVFREVNRVLRPGGLFIAKTPNKFHYMPVLARLTPQRFHEWFNRIRGRPSEDSFPTRYRANSRGDIVRLARTTGFDVASLSLYEGRPEYMRVAAPTYFVGLLYERLVNSTDILAPLRIVLLVELRKISAGAAGEPSVPQ